MQSKGGQMKRTLTMMLGLSLAVSACASDNKKAVSTTPTPVKTAAKKPAPAAAKLSITALTFKIGNKMMLSLKADGTLTTGQGKDGGTLSADGKVTREGKVMAELDLSDGSVMAGGKKMPFTISAAGEMANGPTKLSFNDDGTLAGAPAKMAALKVEGLSPESKRTAMYMLALYFGITAESSTAPTDTAKDTTSDKVAAPAAKDAKKTK
jgi:hypothetical protein